MRSLRLSLTCVLLVLHTSAPNLNPRRRRDSYVSAYKLTHDLNEHFVPNVQDQVRPVHEHAEQPDTHPIYVQNQADEVNGEDFQPSQFQPVPLDPSVSLISFGSSVRPTFSLPESHVSATKPSDAYGPPSPVYVPATVPSPHFPRPYLKPTYIATPHYYEPETGMIPSILQSFLSPQVLIALLDKFRIFKLDLYTIGKVMLKLVILKKILSFITILFLLLVIPNFPHASKGSAGFFGSMWKQVGETFQGVEVDEDEDEEEEGEDDEEAYRKRVTRRRRSRAAINDRWNLFAPHVDEALESFERKFVLRPNGKDADGRMRSRAFSARVRA